MLELLVATDIPLEVVLGRQGVRATEGGKNGAVPPHESVLGLVDGGRVGSLQVIVACYCNGCNLLHRERNADVLDAQQQLVIYSVKILFARHFNTILI